MKPKVYLNRNFIRLKFYVLQWFWRRRTQLFLLSHAQFPKVAKYRRYFFEFLSSKRYSRPYRRGVGTIIEKYLPENGFFVEVGANDGFSESNTYYLERFIKFQGILIESIPHLYQECLKERPTSKVFNCALVSSNYPDNKIEIMYGHTMSLLKSAFDNENIESKPVAIPGRELRLTPEGSWVLFLTK